MQSEPTVSFTASEFSSYQGCANTAWTFLLTLPPAAAITLWEGTASPQDPGHPAQGSENALCCKDDPMLPLNMLRDADQVWKMQTPSGVTSPSRPR